MRKIGEHLTDQSFQQLKHSLQAHKQTRRRICYRTHYHAAFEGSIMNSVDRSANITMGVIILPVKWAYC